MRVGFACVWDKVPEKTWSGTPWHLREALRSQADVVDLGVDHSVGRDMLKLLYIRRRHGQRASVYKWSRTHHTLVQRKIRASLRGSPVDAVVEIGDLARLDVPFYPYKDLSFAVLEHYYDPVVGAPNFRGVDMETIKRRRGLQHEVWESAAGIFAMSEWIADALVESSGVPRHKVHVVYAGLNSVEAVPLDPAPVEAGSSEPPRLLFVGKAFHRKGGDIVLSALARLRSEYARDIRLTVVGPDRWPVHGNVPEGVDFLGNRSQAEVARLYRAHDVFVMPSRFEAFGIVFREALAHGLPVIGRSAFAMPEVVEAGRNGALVDSDDPTELASAVVSVLENPTIRQYTARTAKDVRTQYSWEAVAARMLKAMAESA